MQEYSRKTRNIVKPIKWNSTTESTQLDKSQPSMDNNEDVSSTQRDCSTSTHAVKAQIKSVKSKFSDLVPIPRG